MVWLNIRTCVSSFVVSETAEPWHWSHTKNIPISFALARSSPNMASYWLYPGVVHLLGVVTWPAHVPLWPGHLQNCWAEGDFASSAKSMGEWCTFICIDSHNLMIHVFSKDPTDSYRYRIDWTFGIILYLWNNTNRLIVRIHTKKRAPFSHWLNITAEVALGPKILEVPRCCSSAWRSHVTYLTFGSNCGPQLWRSCDICLAECGVYSSKHPAFFRSSAVTYCTLVADVTGYRSFAAYMERLAFM